MTRWVREDGQSPFEGSLAALAVTCASLPLASPAFSIVLRATMNPTGESVLREGGVEAGLKREWEWLDATDIRLLAAKPKSVPSRGDEPEPLEPAGETELRRIWVPNVSAAKINLMNWKQIRFLGCGQYLALNDKLLLADFPIYMLAGNPMLCVVEDGDEAGSLNLVDVCHNMEATSERDCYVTEGTPDKALFLHRKRIQNNQDGQDNQDNQSQYHYTPLLKRTCGKNVSYVISPRHYSLFEAVAIAANAIGDNLGEDRRSRRIARLKLGAVVQTLEKLNLSQDGHEEEFRRDTKELQKDLDKLEIAPNASAPKGFKEVLRSVSVGPSEGVERSFTPGYLEDLKSKIVPRNRLDDYRRLKSELAELETQSQTLYILPSAKLNLLRQIKKKIGQLKSIGVPIA
eukprot:Protomagalhaensia_wolfi_Nauph_80__1533@NODE_1935_length_1272_cov_25_007299_g1514_i0_p1_GENE_NODE_1935_length_1272_cov_25_007299_g1514_i0NODE_1935_length_1272_cov_25_007299_g1514_i0_p1_ORF_typecomplete_len409_score59_09GIT_CC/PF16559_5/7_9e02GIT_CC/PF16559_5/0_51_NODE_1935_length_1272_cov_25_007299_g1514_i0441249